MKVDSQRRIAADIFKVGLKRVWIDPNKVSEIKESITKADIKGLVKSGLIKILPARGISKAGSRKIKAQKRKGRRKGAGRRKGKANARLNSKDSWMDKIRSQRAFIKELKDKKLIDTKTYRALYLKCKGGFFRAKGISSYT